MRVRPPRYRRRMVERIAVVGGTPTWQRGMTSTISEIGFETTAFAVIGDWAPGRGGIAIIAYSPDDSSLDEIEMFASEYPLIPVVAVIPDLDLSSFSAAIRAGASGVIDDADSIEEFRLVISAATHDRVSAPRHLIRALAHRIPASAHTADLITSAEGELLRALAEGTTVAALADQIGYSERETFRTLGDIYTRIGVANRTEAIIWATRHGILD